MRWPNLIPVYCDAGLMMAAEALDTAHGVEGQSPWSAVDPQIY